MENARNQFPFIGQQVKQEEKNLVAKQPEEYTWIINEGLLRDEGSLYGIAAADITDKLGSITSYYQTKTAFPLQKKQYLEEKIAALRSTIESNLSALSRVKSEQATWLAGQKISYRLWPVAFQFLALLAVGSFNFFLVRYWLSPVIDSDIICMGIYLCGLFSVFIGRGIILDPEEDEAPKQREETSNRRAYIREFGVAAAVSFFICTITYSHYPVQNSVAAFLLLFLLFLCGKVLVNTLFTLKKEISGSYRLMRAGYRARKEERKLLRKNEEAEKTLQTSLEELQEPQMTLNALEAEQQYKTHVFLSEYHLAMQSRQALNKPQLKQLA